MHFFSFFFFFFFPPLFKISLLCNWSYLWHKLCRFSPRCESHRCVCFFKGNVIRADGLIHVGGFASRMPRELYKYNRGFLQKAGLITQEGSILRGTSMKTESKSLRLPGLSSAKAKRCSRCQTELVRAYRIHPAWHFSHFSPLKCSKMSPIQTILYKCTHREVEHLWSEMYSLFEKKKAKKKT